MLRIFLISLIILFLASVPSRLYSQTTVNNVLGIRSAKQSGTIIEKGVIIGYFMFYFKEKNDKDNSSYEVSIFDDNYNFVRNFGLTRPKNSVLLEMVFNNEIFILHFYDRKTGYEFLTFDRDGNQKGSFLINKEQIPKLELERVNESLKDQTENSTLFPLDKQGFIRQNLEKNEKVGYVISRLSNDMKEEWTLHSNPASEFVETADILDVNEEFIIATVDKRQTKALTNVDQYVLVIDSKTGKIISETKLGEKETGRMSVNKTFYDKAENKIVLIGEFFKPGGDIHNTRSLGLFIADITTDGKILSTKQFGWKTEIAAFRDIQLTEEDRKEADKPFQLFFHDVVLTADGHLHLVAEQFRAQISALGLSGLSAYANGMQQTSGQEVAISNLVIIEFDKENNLSGYELIRKKRHPVFLPQGSGDWSSRKMAQYVKSDGSFDFAFTSQEPGSDVYHFVYKDANRKETEDSRNSGGMIGIITVTSGKIETARVPVECNFLFWWMQPAKPGYVAINEYSLQNRKVEIRLEKLGY